MSGMNTCGRSVVVFPEKPAGPTPTIVIGSPLTTRVPPSTEVGSEARAPVAMAQHDHGMCALHAIVVWSEQAAECRADTEGGEVVAGHEHAFGVGGLPAACEVGAEVAMRRRLQGIAVESLEIYETADS